MVDLLVLVRHGKAEPKGPEGDLARELTPDGVAALEEAYPRVFATFEPVGELELWSSPAARAERTAEVAADALGVDPMDIVPHDSLYEQDEDGFLSELSCVDGGTVVAVGQKSGISPITCAVVGSLLGFLVFNVFPAKVFMGDTGSLALGGFVAGTAYMLNMPLFIPIVGLIYAVELLSVVLQVTYFKATHGKRLFKMSPIHHHFELCGWSETRIVAVFSIITALLCLVALMGI